MIGWNGDRHDRSLSLRAGDLYVTIDLAEVTFAHGQPEPHPDAPVLDS
jgi:hypothetical protein